MNKRFLFRKYSVIVPCRKDDLCAFMQKVLHPYPLIRYNLFWHGNPHVLYGECNDRSFHLAANGNMFDAFIPVIHGKIVQIENDECRVEYRLIPNSITIIVSILSLFSLVAFYVRKGLTFKSIASAILFSALFISIIFVVSCISSCIETEKFQKYLEERC